MITLAAGEVRARPFNDHRGLIVLVSVLLHAGLIALLLLIRLPDVRFPQPPKPISVTFIPPSAVPQQQPAAVTVPIPSPTPAPATATPAVAPAVTSQQNDQIALQDAQAFAQMMQQATQVRPMTVVKPTPAPVAPEAEPVVHVEGPAPAMAGTNGPANDDDEQGRVTENNVDGVNQGGPNVGGSPSSGGNQGNIGFAAQGDFNEMLMINIDGIFHPGNDPKMKKFTEKLVACGLGAIDSDNHNWIVELDFTVRPDGVITDMRVKPPDHPSEEHDVAAQELMSIINLPGCGMLTSNRKDEVWHTGELYLFPTDNHNVPFNLRPQSITPFNKTIRLTPQ